MSDHLPVESQFILNTEKYNLGIKPSQQQRFLIQNPVNQYINIFRKDFNQNLSFQLTDINGKLLKQGILSGNSIKISELPNGIYFLRLISTDQYVEIKKLIKTSY